MFFLPPHKERGNPAHKTAHLQTAASQPCLGYVSDIENKYLFQGKELNDEAIDTDSDGNTDTYMNWYDFEARQFDPQIARWHVADPVAQTASPYAAMGNNPVSNIDPNGCAYTGYGSLADRYYYETITWGGENRLGPLHVRQDPSIAYEMQALMEQGQMSADGVYGGGSNNISATLWGSTECANNLARSTITAKQEYQKVKDRLIQTAKIIAKIFKVFNVEVENADEQAWVTVMKYSIINLRTSRDVLQKIMLDLSYDNKGNFIREVFAYEIKSIHGYSSSYLILPSYQNTMKILKKPDGEYKGMNCKMEFPEMGLRMVDPSNLYRGIIINYLETYYRVIGTYHTHPVGIPATPGIDDAWSKYGINWSIFYLNKN